MFQSQFVLTRRGFVRTGTFAAMSTALPYGVRSPSQRHGGSAFRRAPISAALDPEADRIRALLLRAVDAAKTAGAAYADARAVRVVDQTATARRTVLAGADVGQNAVRFGDRLPIVEEVERHAISVRALVDGVWGFTASPWWTDQEAATLARDAVAQARDNAQWAANRVELVPAPVVTGTWTTPLRIDPFTIPVEEKMEWLIRAETAYRPLYHPLDHGESVAFLNLSCQHVTRALATTEGTYTTQHFYRTVLGDLRGEGQDNGLHVDGAHPVFGPMWGQQVWFGGAPIAPGTGWETIADLDLWALGKEAAEQAHHKPPALPIKPVSIGQSTIVMDATTVAQLVDVTIGRAADLDRISGLDANASGTSYLGTDPLALLGTYSFGSPLLNISTTRDGRVGAVTGLPAVRWDDEGVVHTPITIVKDGVLTDVPTTRDRASRLAAYYNKHGRPVASNGCATAGEGFGLELPTVNLPTLILRPNPQPVSWTDMFASVPRGLALTNATIRPDFQGRQLMVSGDVQEIANGRLGARVSGACVMIDAAQLWKNLVTLGSSETARAATGAWSKGVPTQTLSTAVVAVPAVFRDLAVVNGARL